MSGDERPDGDEPPREPPGLPGPGPDDPLSGADEELLRRELEDLEAFLEEHGDEARDRPLDVDVEVRRRKAAVLRGVLEEDAEAGEGEADGGAGPRA